MTVGIAVIGRAPRSDVKEWFSSMTQTDVLLRGCMDDAPDGLFYTTAEGLTDPLYTTLPDGRTAVIAKADVVAGAPKAVARLREDGARTILFNCTGAFPDFEGSAGVIFPSRLLAALVFGRRPFSAHRASRAVGRAGDDASGQVAQSGTRDRRLREAVRRCGGAGRCGAPPCP